MSRTLMEGSEAIVEAALAAGCRFFAGYPMTPFTEVLENFAEKLPGEVLEHLRERRHGIAGEESTARRDRGVGDGLGALHESPGHDGSPWSTGVS